MIILVLSVCKQLHNLKSNVLYHNNLNSAYSRYFFFFVLLSVGFDKGALNDRAAVLVAVLPNWKAGAGTGVDCKETKYQRIQNTQKSSFILKNIENFTWVEPNWNAGVAVGAAAPNWKAGIAAGCVAAPNWNDGAVVEAGIPNWKAGAVAGATGAPNVTENA